MLIPFLQEEVVVFDSATRSTSMARLDQFRVVTVADIEVVAISVFVVRRLIIAVIVSYPFNSGYFPENYSSFAE